jgi:hypothetical protein
LATAAEAPAEQTSGAVLSFAVGVTPDRRELEVFDEIRRDQEQRRRIASDPLQPIVRHFEPVVLHFKHVELTCSLITAIKRKNPLCLLNPMVLGISF